MFSRNAIAIAAAVGLSGQSVMASPAMPPVPFFDPLWFQSLPERPAYRHQAKRGKGKGHKQHQRAQAKRHARRRGR